MKVIPGNSKPVSILVPTTTNAALDDSMSAASEATPARVTATISEIYLLVAKQIWLEARDIGTVRTISKVTGFLNLDWTKTVAPKVHLMPGNGIKEVRQNVPLDIVVANLTSNTVHVPKYMVLCASSDNMVNITDSRQVDKERCQTIATVYVTSKPPV